MDKIDDKIIVIDFGSQGNQNVVRFIRELGVYSEMVDHEITADTIKKDSSIKGIVIADGSKSVLDNKALNLDNNIWNIDLPILTLGYGTHLLVKDLKGTVVNKEEIIDEITIVKEDTLIKGISSPITMNVEVKDVITILPQEFNVLGTTQNNNPSIINKDNINGLIFSLDNKNETTTTILDNFISICGCERTWSIQRFIEKETKAIREQVGDEHVILGLSGGVDSSVVAALLHHAIGNQLTCIFVDHGLMRKGEPESVKEIFSDHFKMNLIQVDAKDRFLDKLKGIVDPEQKRKIIGKEFIEVFNDETKKLTNAKWLAQGTIYADILESGTKASEVIKSHHNVGGLPEDMEFKLIEPLSTLFKDEVREVGIELGLPHNMVYRQPFPGPGLGVRIIGEITKDKIRMEQEADYILREEFSNHGLDKTVWQYFVVLTDTKSVGVTKGKRTYASMAAIRAVHSIDGMKANWAQIPYEVLGIISDRIINEVDGINRVVYDITAKPPGTIEWE